MPRCDGRAVGPGSTEPCPNNRNDSTIRGRQGELMLCDACTEFRFLSGSSKSTSSAVTYQTRRKQYTRSEHVPTKTQNVPAAGDAAINGECCHYCPVCQETVDANSVKCNICDDYFHQGCSGMSPDTFRALLMIVIETGWVCLTCRSECRGRLLSLQASVAGVTEQLSDVHTVLSQLTADHDNVKTSVVALQNAWPTPAEGAVLSNVVSDGSESASVMLQKSEVSTVSLVVQQTMNDIARRKHNIVITGLPESPSSDSEQIKLDDQNAFLSLCEQYLDVKLAIAAKGCVRVGKQDSHRNQPRKLLIHLKSESSAADVIKAGYRLRRVEDCQGIYINPDMSPAQAKIAFEKRQQRRKAAQLKAANAQTSSAGGIIPLTNQDIGQSTPTVFSYSRLSAAATDFVPATSD